jgi:hypothetical protein
MRGKDQPTALASIQVNQGAQIVQGPTRTLIQKASLEKVQIGHFGIQGLRAPAAGHEAA